MVVGCVEVYVVVEDEVVVGVEGVGVVYEYL